MKKFDCPHCHKIFEGDQGEGEVISCPHCNDTVEIPEEDLIPGTMIGGFEIIRLLGHGGMGNVYLANQISMNRPVALKILLESMTRDKISVKQFLNEAKVSGQMNHRNIITAIDAGEIDDRYFLVTTFVDGQDIEKRLEEDKNIPEKETLRIAIKMGESLKYAWEGHGILHKDIKPGNIMLDSSGEPYLMDMGIAQYIGETPSKDEHIVGSPFFMSPEQSRAERLSWTSDLYSLGATMYNMIVGVPPFDANDVMKIIEMHSNAPFPMPKTRNPNVKISKGTVMLIKKMMAKNPNERFDSWGGFKEAAIKALKGKPPSGAASKKLSPSKKKRGRQVLKKSGSGGIMGLLVILLLLGVCIGATVFFFKKNKFDKAKAYLERAKTYYINHPGDYKASIEIFRKATEYAKGTKLESRTEQRYLLILQESKEQAELNLKYKEAKTQVGVLVKNKQYQEAINLLQELVKDIKGPDAKRDADMYIKQLKAQLK